MSDKRNVQVVILTVTMGPQEQTGSMGTIGGNSGLYYYLPGAGLAEVRSALTKAGFKVRDRILDAIEGAAGTDNT